MFNVNWPNSQGLIESFCTVCEQPWVDLNPRPFAQKATTLTTATRRYIEIIMAVLHTAAHACTVCSHLLWYSWITFSSRSTCNTCWGLSKDITYYTNHTHHRERPVWNPNLKYTQPALAEFRYEHEGNIFDGSNSKDEIEYKNLDEDFWILSDEKTWRKAILYLQQSGPAWVRQ